MSVMREKGVGDVLSKTILVKFSPEEWAGLGLIRAWQNVGMSEYIRQATLDRLASEVERGKGTSRFTKNVDETRAAARNAAMAARVQEE